MDKWNKFMEKTASTRQFFSGLTEKVREKAKNAYNSGIGGLNQLEGNIKFSPNTSFLKFISTLIVLFIIIIELRFNYFCPKDPAAAKRATFFQTRHDDIINNKWAKKGPQSISGEELPDVLKQSNIPLHTGDIASAREKTLFNIWKQNKTKSTKIRNRIALQHGENNWDDLEKEVQEGIIHQTYISDLSFAKIAQNLDMNDVKVLERELSNIHSNLRQIIIKKKNAQSIQILSFNTKWIDGGDRLKQEWAIIPDNFIINGTHNTGLDASGIETLKKHPDLVRHLDLKQAAAAAANKANAAGAAVEADTPSWKEISTDDIKLMFKFIEYRQKLNENEARQHNVDYTENTCKPSIRTPQDIVDIFLNLIKILTLGIIDIGGEWKDDSSYFKTKDEGAGDGILNFMTGGGLWIFCFVVFPIVYYSYKSIGLASFLTYATYINTNRFGKTSEHPWHYFIGTILVNTILYLFLEVFRYTQSASAFLSSIDQTSHTIYKHAYIWRFLLTSIFAMIIIYLLTKEFYETQLNLMMRNKLIFGIFAILCFLVLFVFAEILTKPNLSNTGIIEGFSWLGTIFTKYGGNILKVIFGILAFVALMFIYTYINLDTSIVNLIFIGLILLMAKYLLWDSSIMVNLRNSISGANEKAKQSFYEDYSKTSKLVLIVLIIEIIYLSIYVIGPYFFKNFSSHHKEKILNPIYKERAEKKYKEITAEEDRIKGNNIIARIVAAFFNARKYERAVDIDWNDPWVGGVASPNIHSYAFKTGRYNKIRKMLIDKGYTNEKKTSSELDKWLDIINPTTKKTLDEAIDYVMINGTRLKELNKEKIKIAEEYEILDEHTKSHQKISVQKEPIYLDSERIYDLEENFKEDTKKGILRNHGAPAKSMSPNFNYSLTFWVMIHDVSAKRAGYTNIINYSNQPRIEYDGNNHKMRIKMNLFPKVEHEISKNTKREVTIKDDLDIPLQKWNYFVINYKGGTLNIFLNNKLIVTEKNIIPAMKYTTIRVGDTFGISGGICNVVYYPKVLERGNITDNYNRGKLLDIPLY